MWVNAEGAGAGAGAGADPTIGLRQTGHSSSRTMREVRGSSCNLFVYHAREPSLVPVCNVFSYQDYHFTVLY